MSEPMQAISKCLNCGLESPVITAQDTGCPFCGSLDSSFLATPTSGSSPELKAALDRIKKLEEKLNNEWKDIKDFKSGRVVFIYYENDLGKGRTVKALYAGKYEIEDEFSIGDFTEYDEKTDRNYWPEGWYEDVEAETGLDYSFHHLGDIKPTHFMEIPEPPTTQEREREE